MTRLKYLIWLSIALLLVSGCAKRDTAQTETTSPEPTKTAIQTVQPTQISGSLLPTIPEVTSDKSISTKWIGQEGEKLYINNKEAKTDAKGNIIIDELKLGENEIDLMLYSGRRLIMHQKKTITYEPFPVLNVLTPVKAEASTDKPFTIISGSATPGSKLFIDSNEVSVGTDGFFSQKFVLIPGKNSFIVKAVGKEGKVVTSMVNVNFNPPLPTVTIQTPNFDSAEVYNSIDNNLTLIGFTEPYNLVQVFVNPDDQNEPMLSAAYESTVDASGKFSASVKLSESMNILRLIVTNRFGNSVSNDYPVTGKNAPSINDIDTGS